MVLTVCVDDQYGMRFNRRRQSRDRAVCADLLTEAGGRTLWMAPESRTLFPEEAEGICAAVDFLEQAGNQDLCFAETPPLRPWLDRVNKLVIYRWNRRYPADQRLDFDPLAEGFRLDACRDFPGLSHASITKEVYLK